MAPPLIIRLIIVLFSLILISSALADSPADNDIPTLAMRLIAPATMFYDITYDLLCELSWKNFDAVNFGGWASNPPFLDLMSRCDNLGMYYSISPREINQYFVSLDWGDEDATELRLKISALGNTESIPDPIDVRIGWVRLEESGQ